MVRYPTDLGYRTLRYSTTLGYCKLKGKIVTVLASFLVQTNLQELCIFELFWGSCQNKGSCKVIIP